MKGVMINDTIYDSIINISFIDGDDCGDSKCHGRSWCRIIWRCNYMYRIDCMAYQATIQEKKIGRLGSITGPVLLSV